MKIGQYILELLDDYDYVVFPGLGAFTVKEVPASLSDGDKVLLPPSRQIGFSKDIRINDGILLNHFAHAEGLSAPKALIEIEKLCADILYRLDHGEAVDFDALGTLRREKDEYKFIPVKGSEVHPGSFGLEPVKLKTAKHSEATAPTTDEKLKVDIKPKERKFTRLYWLFALPVIGLAVFSYWFSMQNRKEMVPERQNAQIQESIKPEPVLVPESVADTTMQQVAVDIPANEVKHPQKGLYYLVGGSFKTRENAEQFFEQALKKGYEPVHLGEIGNFHVVALAVYPSEREAVNAQNTILRNDSTTGVWVYFLKEP